MVQFLIVMTCICAKLVSVAHANRFMKSHWVIFFVFLVHYLKTMFLNSLKIMKKSLITKYNDRCFIIDLLMQHKLFCVNLIGRSWRTWKTNQITPTYLKAGINNLANLKECPSPISTTVVLCVVVPEQPILFICNG